MAMPYFETIRMGDEYAFKPRNLGWMGYIYIRWLFQYLPRSNIEEPVKYIPSNAALCIPSKDLLTKPSIRPNQVTSSS